MKAKNAVYNLTVVLKDGSNHKIVPDGAVGIICGEQGEKPRVWFDNFGPHHVKCKNLRVHKEATNES